MGRVAGKVALVTGAARGQGRSHAVRLAEEGADIIAVDICERVASSSASMGTLRDLEETVRLVEQFDRRIVATKTDIRDRVALEDAVAQGVGELGRLDIVSANAGMVSTGRLMDLAEQTWQDVIDVNLTGAYHTAIAAVPHIIAGGRGGSFVFTGSVMGVSAVQNLGHYSAAKHGLLGLMKTLALEHGDQFIRFNAVLPSNVDTDMIQNENVWEKFLPHLERPTREDAAQPGSNYYLANALPVPWVDPVDVSNAVLFLASDEARFITGAALPVDAGFLIK